MANPPTVYFVDPAIAADSGAGTVGDPYGDLQYCLDTITRDTGQGDRICVKAGTDEVLAASLTLATYGTPSAYVPLIIQGYTSAAQDGGIGVIDCNGVTGMASSGYDGIMTYDMEWKNSGTGNHILNLDNYCTAINCKFTGPCNTCYYTWGGVYTLVAFCDFYNPSGSCMLIGVNGGAFWNYLLDGPATWNPGVYLSYGSNFIGNIIVGTDVATTTHGIYDYYESAVIANNSFYRSNNWGIAIHAVRQNNTSCYNNLIEGWNTGINNSLSTRFQLMRNNACFNTTTPFAAYGAPLYQTSGVGDDDIGQVAILSESPFRDATNKDFRPVQTNGIGASTWPKQTRHTSHAMNLWRGAIQPARGPTFGALARSGGRSA